MAKARREQKAATCLWKTKVVVVAYWQWGGHKNRDEEKKREVFFAFPPRNSWWWHHMWKEAPTTRLFKKSGVQGNKKKWEGGRVVVVRAIKALRYLWHMFGSFLHPLLLPTFFFTNWTPPTKCWGGGGTVGNGGWTDGYKITKANDYLLKKDCSLLYRGNWRFLPKKSKKFVATLCVGWTSFFSPTFSISSKFLVEERSPRGLTVVVRRQTGTRQRL